MGYYSLLNWGIHEKSRYRGEAHIVTATGPAETAKSNRGASEAYRIKYGNTPNKSRIYRRVSRVITLADSLVVQSWVKHFLTCCFSVPCYSCWVAHGVRKHLSMRHGNLSHNHQYHLLQIH